ncbi:MAG: DNA phosphorothioation-associated DGQHR protein 1 [Nitrosospira sp.]
MITFPMEVKALRVEQPIGIYYVTVLPAAVLLEVAYSDVLSAHLRPGEDTYELIGTQRLVQPKRLQVIADYINRTNSAFPNSIILGVNYRKEDGLLEDDEPAKPENEDSEKQSDNDRESKSWSIEETDNGCCILKIPTNEKLAAIIDGQHRLFAFVHAHENRLKMNLVCSVFLDLPKPFQAQLFATINSTQKPVDKSLTYELFGYNIDEEDEPYWTPDKLAVFLTRRLGIDEKSPLKGRIAIAPRMDKTLVNLTATREWKVSTAVVVEGIMRLFTSNPKKDNTNLLEGERKKRSVLTALRKDNSPLRNAYISEKDAVIYTLTLNYLIACNETFWSKATGNSFIVKTVGIQALFDILRLMAAEAYQKRDISVANFANKLKQAEEIDFSEDQFRNASGSGRSFIKKSILEAID